MNEIKDTLKNKEAKKFLLNGLKGFEIVKKIYLSKELFTIDNQILTPTGKIKRHIAKKTFLDVIQKLFILKPILAITSSIFFGIFLIYLSFQNLK